MPSEMVLAWMIFAFIFGMFTGGACVFIAFPHRIRRNR